MNIKESAENLGLEEEEYLELLELFIDTGTTDLVDLQSAVEKTHGRGCLRGPFHERRSGKSRIDLDFPNCETDRGDGS